MHEIYRCVGLEQVAPGALTRMWFTGHQQHTQFVAHAVDRNHGAVIHLRQFAFKRRGLYLDDIRSSMWNWYIQLDVGVYRDNSLFQDLSVTADGDFGGAGLCALILDAESDGLRLTDNAETRRQRQDDPTVDFVFLAGNQRVQWCRQSQCGSIRRDVVDSAIGDQYGASHTVRRHIGERGRQCREQLGAIGFAVSGAGFGHTYFETRDSLEPLHQRVACLFRLPCAIAEILARTFVDNDGGD